jgi:hypothetical protein
MERSELGLSEWALLFSAESPAAQPALPVYGVRTNRSAQVPFGLIRGLRLPVRPGGHLPPAKCRAGADRPTPTQQPRAAPCC